MILAFAYTLALILTLTLNLPLLLLVLLLGLGGTMVTGASLGLRANQCPSMRQPSGGLG